MKPQPTIEICEVPTTGCKNTDKSSDRSAIRTTVCRRRVRFAAKEETHIIDRVPTEEQDHIWYTTQHIESFRKQTQNLACRPNTWTKPLVRVYCALRSNCSPQDAAMILEEASKNIVVNEDTVGLTQGSISTIASDYLLRRQHLTTQLKYLQEIPMPNEDMRARMIYDTSRLTSQASRLFASYVAEMALKEQ